MISQTDPEFYGWAFAFPVKEENCPEWRELNADAQRRWLESWNPPKEWMQ